MTLVSPLLVGGFFAALALVGAALSRTSAGAPTIRKWSLATGVALASLGAGYFADRLAQNGAEPYGVAKPVTPDGVAPETDAPSEGDRLAEWVDYSKRLEQQAEDLRRLLKRSQDAERVAAKKAEAARDQADRFWADAQRMTDKYQSLRKRANDLDRERKLEIVRLTKKAETAEQRYQALKPAPLGGEVIVCGPVLTY